MFRRRYRVQFSGGNTRLKKQKQAYIAVPMEWLNEHGVEKGDYLVVKWRRDEAIIMVQMDNEKTAAHGT
jgi:hypothetical protein